MLTQTLFSIDQNLLFVAPASEPKFVAWQADEEQAPLPLHKPFAHE